MPLFSLQGAFDETSARQYDLVARRALEPLFDLTVKEITRLGGGSFAPGSIVDLGSGPGVLTHRLARQFPQAEVTGIEPSTPMLKRANATPAPGVRFIEGSAENIPLPDASADLLVSHNSIKHWRDRTKGLQEIARVLKPGGILWMCEIDRDARWPDAWRFIRQTGKPLMVLPFKLIVVRNGLSAPELARLLKDLPFESIQVAPADGLPMIRAMGRRA
ncbi:MAG: class I SAM-dependent methyltransferase [Deltaproteobacteria bacterium]|nr:class I SAM-dependent methyltransferase [Deltaproteobacteria bacterium]